MAKFKSSVDGTLYVPGHSVIQLEKGKSVSSNDPVVVAALSANPDLTEQGKEK